ncbi:hypothetical protein WJX72_008584 [[Myrmecia] bisecta]|uniref:Uncharacterized protein n=1 Tax=[Myrmecia] bisecta TaxID=41462 RepID=A0AAW1R8N3_9CHLO
MAAKQQQAERDIEEILNSSAGQKLNAHMLARQLAERKLPEGVSFATHYNVGNLSEFLDASEQFFVAGKGPFTSRTVMMNRYRRKTPSPDVAGGPSGAPSNQPSSAPEDAASPIPDAVLERKLVEYLQHCPERRAHLGSGMGSYMKKANLHLNGPLSQWLGIDMKGRLGTFLSERSDKFVMESPDRAANGQAQAGRQDEAAAQRLERELLLHLLHHPGQPLAQLDQFAHTQLAAYLPEGWNVEAYIKERSLVFTINNGMVYIVDEAREILEGSVGVSPENVGAFVAGVAYRQVSGVTAALSSVHKRQEELQRLAQECQQQLGTAQDLSALRQENASIRQHCAHLDSQLRELRHQLETLIGKPLPYSGAAAMKPALNGLHHASPHGNGIMADSKLYILGGHDGQSWLDLADCFQPATKQWKRLPLLEGPRSFAAAAHLDQRIYLCGGSDGTHWFDTVLSYDTRSHTSRSWQVVAPMCCARGSLAVAAVAGRLYACGGGLPGAQHSLTEMYDPVVDKWFHVADLNSRRFALGATTVGSAMYAVGGFDGSAYLTSVERLDPREGRWSTLTAAMAVRRGSLAVTSANDVIYAVGGFDSEVSVASVEVLDPRAARWRSVAPMADGGRAYGAAVTCNNQVYALGGLLSDMTTHATLLERYDALRDQWEECLEEQQALPSTTVSQRAFIAACASE